ncbi:MAG: DNA-binding response regulator [Firmicutes bacterium HGW-Firmicutes-7]|nr:MAG: DNA-binding response regulator [Firmicutes bacterium HGW-Firmicutes-7]
MGKILIVEDDVNTRSGLVKIAKSINACSEVYETGAARKALEIAKSEVIDAFFLDIQLEDYTGLELAEQIREMDIYRFTPIIFITGVHCSELEAFRNIQCYKYMIKPFTNIEVARVFQDVVTHGIVGKKVPDIIKVKEKGITYVMNQDDIICVESMHNNLLIRTLYENAIIKKCSLSKISDQLTNKFIRCHKGFIVNCYYIKKVDKTNNFLYLEKNNDPIPIGRKFKDSV